MTQLHITTFDIHMELIWLISSQPIMLLAQYYPIYLRIDRCHLYLDYPLGILITNQY